MRRGKDLRFADNHVRGCQSLGEAAAYPAWLMLDVDGAQHPTNATRHLRVMDMSSSIELRA